MLRISSRSDRLGWAVTSWGAVRLEARHDVPLERRRVGRYTPRGRETEREIVGQGPDTTATTLQLVIPQEGRWSDEEPELLIERANHGEPLCGSELCLEEWEDDLLDLSLDVASRHFAVRWRDLHQDWVVFSVGGGGGLATSVGPAGWTSRQQIDPFQGEPAYAH